MMDINKVILLGRLGADPIQRKTKSGIAVTHFSVATSRRIFKDPTASAPSTEEGAPAEESPETSPQEETQWHRIVAWGKQAETCTQYLHKGNAVYIEGNIRSRNYADKQGAQKTTFEIHAETVSFLGSRGQAFNGPGAQIDSPAPLQLAASE